MGRVPNPPPPARGRRSCLCPDCVERLKYLPDIEGAAEAIRSLVHRDENSGVVVPVLARRLELQRDGDPVSLENGLVEARVTRPDRVWYARELQRAARREHEKREAYRLRQEELALRDGWNDVPSSTWAGFAYGPLLLANASIGLAIDPRLWWMHAVAMTVGAWVLSRVVRFGRVWR